MDGGTPELLLHCFNTATSTKFQANIDTGKVVSITTQKQPDIMVRLCALRAQFFRQEFFAFHFGV